MAVPFFRLDVSDAERAAVDRILQSGWLTTGGETKHFEKEFADYIGGDVEAIAVNSNTAGMHLALEAMDITSGDEVIVPSLTFTATAEVVRYLGADPAFVDVDPETRCIDPDLVEAAITEKTKAIIPVHFGGLAADISRLSAIADRYGLQVLEDAAHSFPTTHHGKIVGSLNTSATVFSFYANKTITTGEGGMIVTRDRELAARCRVMRLHGMDRDAFARFTGTSSQWRYDVIAPGFKYNLTDIAAAIGREQLKNAENKRAKRQAIAERYIKALSELPIELPPTSGDDVHSWHLFPIRVLAEAQTGRDELAEHLSSSDIGYSVHYWPLHRMTYWQSCYNLDDARFPVSSRHGDTSISLPIFDDMRDAEITNVINAVRSFFTR